MVFAHFTSSEMRKVVYYYGEKFTIDSKTYLVLNFCSITY